MSRQSNDLGLESMFELKSSEKLLIGSFNIFVPRKNNIIKCLCSFIISLILAGVIGFSLYTIDIMEKVAETFIAVYIGLLGVTFTGYAFFQALITGKLIELLIDRPDERKKENKFLETNESFVKLILLYIFFLLMNIILKILFSSIDVNTNVFSNAQVNNSVATMGIIVYMYCSLIAVWHVKSYVYNIFQIFNLRAIREYLDNKSDNQSS